MQILLKVVLSLVIILGATEVGRKLPSAAGLISVMPLTSVLVLVWMYFENKGNLEIMEKFARGALWGIVPSIIFFLVAFICFKKHLSLPITLLSSFGAWFAAAGIHQWVLK